MASRFPEEFKAITDARDANPKEKALTLAKSLAMTATLASRTVLSTYSVIRRYDASKKAAAKAAKKNKTAALAGV